MSFENLGEWEIEHIIPLSLAKSREQVVVLCHHQNLQPLWKEENDEKDDKVIPDMVQKALRGLVPIFGEAILREILSNASQDGLADKK